MTVDPAAINAVFSGLVLLLGALAGLVTARGRKAGIRQRDYRDLQRRFLVSLTHVFTLETALAAHGIKPPARPTGLDPTADEDDSPVPALPPQPRPET